MQPSTFLRTLVEEQKRGVPCGIPSVCSAHPLVLRAAAEQARDENRPVLVESTVNQVNQQGGYTGMRPANFAAVVRALAAEAGLSPEWLILGADHLGPYPWRNERAEEAMGAACTLAAETVRAGYAKIHLDASMPLGGDALGHHGGIELALIAAREAEMAEASEGAWAEYRKVRPGAEAPVYVIGTEVPLPGGSLVGGGEAAPTPAADLFETVEECRAAFRRRGLTDAWERVVAVVVQPGVEYSDQTVIPYRRESARELCHAARSISGIVLEGHSTDYQTPVALRELVEDGVAILKVGPALTFALRESLFALEMIERELFEGDATVNLSRLRSELEAAMLADPSHWRGYYRGHESDLRIARCYSLSDRSRYYWSVARVKDAVDRLTSNLAAASVPVGLFSQYLPLQSRRVLRGELPPQPMALALDAVREALRKYFSATRAPS